MRSATAQRLFNQRSPSVKRHGRQPKPRSLFSPISARRCMPRDITTTPVSRITTPRWVTLSRHVSSCRIAARFLNRWPISHAGEPSGTGASHTSTKPSGSTRAMLTYSPSTRLPISTFVVSPKRCELEPFLKEQPENYRLIGDLALINMGLGEKAAALALAERAMAANPIEKDAVTGPAPIEILARVAAQIGELDRAITALQKLLSIPYAGPLATQNVPLTPALLRLDPMFDPLRNDPRFQRLCASPTPK